MLVICCAFWVGLSLPKCGTHVAFQEHPCSAWFQGYLPSLDPEKGPTCHLQVCRINPWASSFLGMLPAALTQAGLLRFSASDLGLSYWNARYSLLGAWSGEKRKPWLIHRRVYTEVETAAVWDAEWNWLRTNGQDGTTPDWRYRWHPQPLVTFWFFSFGRPGCLSCPLILAQALLLDVMACCLSYFGCFLFFF